VKTNAAGRVAIEIEGVYRFENIPAQLGPRIGLCEDVFGQALGAVPAVRLLHDFKHQLVQTPQSYRGSAVRWNEHLDILTVREVAAILRYSKAHVTNVKSGKVAGIERLTHLGAGRRKLVRGDWLEHWMENNKARSDRMQVRTERQGMTARSTSRRAERGRTPPG